MNQTSFDHDTQYPRQTHERQHGHAVHGLVQARLAQSVHPGCAAAECRPAEYGRPSLYPALYPGARGSEPDHGFQRPQPPAAQGGGRVPARRGVGHRQPQGCTRSIGWRHPREPLDEARCGRRRHRWRFSRFARDRQAALPRLPPSPGRADQSHAAPGVGHQRTHRLR